MFESSFGDLVTIGLGRRWSPEQIDNRLRLDRPQRPDLWISHESIYKALYMRGHGGIRKQMRDRLRTKQQRRRRRRNGGRIGVGVGRGKIANMTHVSMRPKSAESRSVAGHWEGDLIISRSSKGRSQLGTLVDRKTRYVVLVPITDRRAITVADAVSKRFCGLPESLRLSLTWDQGLEMARHDLVR